MKTRPILFSAPMVRAILDGTKTQTRRVVKLTTERDGCAPGMAKLRNNTATPLRDGIGLVWTPYAGAERDQPMPPETVSECCPYGQPGDRLWVRETFAPCLEPENHAYAKAGFTYRADWSTEDDCECRDFKWKPSIFCTRAASRITLEITSVRVERLNKISEDDAKAEGCDWQKTPHFANSRLAYRTLWDSINGPCSWDTNPYVWVIQFRRVQP